MVDLHAEVLRIARYINDIISLSMSDGVENHLNTKKTVSLLTVEKRINHLYEK